MKIRVHRQKFLLPFAALISLIILLPGCGGSTDSASISLDEAVSNGRPTLAEFGSSSCVPCKQMKPVLEQLSDEYEGKLNVVLIEVYDNVELARQYGIMGIPTQIFFDSYGKEVFRHAGFFPREEIDVQLGKMGID